jgi:transposase InsO family protein
VLAERSFGTLQLELLERGRLRTEVELVSTIIETLGLLRPSRRHSSIGNLSPVEFESRFTDTAVAA